MSVRNNEALRVLFTLPPIPASASTVMAVTEAPRPESVTGDQEVDAVLWLQRIVAAGDQALIDKAMEAVKRITTPMKTLADRYSAHLIASGHHAMQVAFASFGFGDLEGQAKRAVQEAARRHEALARFGDVDTAFAETPAEKACKKALRGLKRDRKFDSYDDAEALDRFNHTPALVLATIDDCLYARAYWNKLYWLRAAIGDFGDSTPQGYAHECYCRAMLEHLRPRNAAEALAAFDHLDADDGTDWERAQPIIRNLIASGWNHAAPRSAAPVADERAAFTALSDLVNALRERHYGRMPEEVQQAYDRAWAIVFATPDVALASAPVADESPMAKMADALREKGRQEQQAYQDSRVQSTEWGPMPHGTEADLPASAPVADVKDWRIDTSAGGPILVYKDCSVIESEQAEYVLRLIAADQASAPVAGPSAVVLADRQPRAENGGDDA